MKRRDFLKTSMMAGGGLTILPSMALSRPSARKKMLVLGIDGLDPKLVHKFLGKGLMPNFNRIIESGGISPVATSNPPQSPVAWSNLTVGAGPSTHGIYDFIHREPETMIPYLSTSRVTPPETVIEFGDYRIPLEEGKTELLRKGRPFWDYLTERDLPTTIFKMPANFPTVEGEADMVSGMGTPDLLGGYGTFTMFTTVPEQYPADISGGRVIPVYFDNDQADFELPGPANSLKKGAPETAVPVTVWRDRLNDVARIKIQDKEFILNRGEWTGWFRVSFPMLGPFYDVKGIIKIFVKDLNPDFSLYVSPINIDPTDPALPIFSSEEYGHELSCNCGFFYTQGLPDDTKALSSRILGEDQYLQLAEQVIKERERLLFYELERFNRRENGLLFFYFSSLDQNSHMYWRALDPRHPLYDPMISAQYGEKIQDFYIEMDMVLGKVLTYNDLSDPNFTMMIMSDHGFNSFRRQVNLNTWLHRQGYLELHNKNDIADSGYFTNVDWSRTGAYNLGINSVYLNLEGREREGAVTASQADKLRKSIRNDLLAMRDEETGDPAVSGVWIIPGQEHRRNPHAPDLIVGWNTGYRISWDSILGGFTNHVFADNLDKWSGDHCVDPRHVPATLITNRQIVKPDPDLRDLTATVLDQFDIEVPAEIEGKPIFRKT
ncbi:MAG: hypothetical protein FVQ81_06165 [Candidatus Glassbacteria bacterium]|nr:hypothetical protein [Candidatus Glassbacteria bacterium]